MIHIRIRKKTALKLRKRLRNKARLRKKIFGTNRRPRLVVFRSQKHIYAQLVNDEAGRVLYGMSSLKQNVVGGNCEGAKQVGQEMAKQLQSKKVKTIVFDRNGFIYHGRVKAFAEALREGGLVF